VLADEAALQDDHAQGLGVPDGDAAHDALNVDLLAVLGLHPEAARGAVAPMRRCDNHGD
jgi:hypothetical protein